MATVGCLPSLVYRRVVVDGESNEQIIALEKVVDNAEMMDAVSE